VFPQRWQLTEARFPHLLRLVKVGTVSMLAFRANFRTPGASHDQADAQRSKNSTFQAIHIQFSVMDIVTKSFEMSKTGLGIS
jgi:hypothetical protein